MKTARENLSSRKSSVSSLLSMLLVLPVLAVGSGCASNLAIYRGPLTGPFVLAESNGEFRVHATVTNGGKSKSSASILEVCPNVSVADGSSADCLPYQSGWMGARNCAVPALDPDDSKSFNFVAVKDLCDKTHCCLGMVGLRLTDELGAPLKGDDTEMEVSFDRSGDLDGMKILLPSDAGYMPLKCEHQFSPSNCTK